MFPALISGRLSLNVRVINRKAALRQKETAQHPEIVEDPAAGGHVQVELGEIVGDQEQRFFAAVRAIVFCRLEFRFDIPARFSDGFGQHRHVFVGTLDAVKRRFGDLAHNTVPFLPPLGWPIETWV